MIRKLLALTLTGFLAIGLVSCQEAGVASQEVASEFAPEITVEESREDHSFASDDGVPVTLDVQLGMPKLTGVSDGVLAKFDEAVSGLREQSVMEIGLAIERALIADLSCSDKSECVIPLYIEATEAVVFEDFGSVTYVSSILLGTTSSSHSSSSVTMNLRDGSLPELSEFIDFGAASTEAALNDWLRGLPDLQNCSNEADDYLSEVPTWSLSDAGIVFTWTSGNSRLPNACGPVTATLPWPDDVANTADLDAGDIATAALVIPGCATMNPLAQSERDEFIQSWGGELNDRTGPASLDAFALYAGPAAQEAMGSVSAQQGCYWLLYVHGNNLTQFTAEIEQAPRDKLLAELRKSDFIESSLGKSTLFTLSVEDPENARMVGATSIQYIFVGNAWLTLVDSGASDYSQSALDALLAANPGL